MLFRSRKFSIRRFSWKLAGRTFAGVVAFDLVLEVLTQLFTDPDKMTWLEWLFAVPFWTINFPGLPFIHFARDSANGATILISVLAVFLLGAAFWSVVIGYYFGHRLPPNKSPEPTAVGAVSSAVAVHAASRRWLSFLRSAAARADRSLTELLHAYDNWCCHPATVRA